VFFDSDTNREWAKPAQEEQGGQDKTEAGNRPGDHTQSLS